MSFTYDVTTNRGKTRFLCGDTDSADAILQDDEIDFCIDQAGNNFGAAAIACEAIAAEFSRKADKQVGDLRISLSQKAEAYGKRAADLRRRGNVLCVPTVGGVSIADKDEQRDDTDRVTPSFARGLHESSEAIADSRFSNFSGEDN